MVVAGEVRMLSASVRRVSPSRTRAIPKLKVSQYDRGLNNSHYNCEINLRYHIITIVIQRIWTHNMGNLGTYVIQGGVAYVS